MKKKNRPSTKRLLIRVLLALALLLFAFLTYVATRPSAFHYSRSGVINASADKIYPYLSDFKLGRKWSPFDQDEKTERTYSGPARAVGSVMEFKGGGEGSGRLEILILVPNQLVAVQLEMLTPFYAKNLIHYKLSPEGKATRFTWEMSGDGGFMSKLMSVLIDCDKMIHTQFDQGIGTLKTVVEAQVNSRQ